MEDKPILTFDSTTFPKIRKIFGLKNAKCMYCQKQITKNNIGGFHSKQIVFCNDSVCLNQYVKENKEK